MCVTSFPYLGILELVWHGFVICSQHQRWIHLHEPFLHWFFDQEESCLTFSSLCSSQSIVHISAFLRAQMRSTTISFFVFPFLHSQLLSGCFRHRSCRLGEVMGRLCSFPTAAKLRERTHCATHRCHPWSLAPLLGDS